MKKLPSFFLLVLLLALTVTAQQAAAETRQQTNLLTNSSFEDPYNADGAASGWARWNQDSGVKPENCSDAYAFFPKWSRETNPQLVRDGFIAQHVGNQFDTWHGGVMQTVNVTPGTTYRFSFWSIGRASNEQYPVASDPAVNLGVRAGIDPNGSGNWKDTDVIWGGTISPHDAGNQANWQQAVVEATATGSQMTVYVTGDVRGANQCRAHLDIWFDAAQLTEVGPPPTNTPPPQPTLPPPPPVTNTPVPPTPTPTPDVTATNTPVPTETPTNTPEPPTTGLLCVNAFADNNANGQRETEEGSMAGVTFTIAQSNEIAGQGVSTGPDPVCFDLEPGNYQVVQNVPPALEMTTGASTGITLNEGQTVRVEFGSRVRPQTADADNTASGGTLDPVPGETTDVTDVTEDEGGLSNSLVALSGLGALFLAIIMLGVLIYLLLRQRAA